MNPEQVAQLIRAGLPGRRGPGRIGRQHPLRRARRRAEFAGKRSIARHQLIYERSGERMGREIHALSIEALTPEEVERRALATR